MRASSWRLQRAQMARLVGVELFKMRKRWMPWVLLAILVIALCAIFLSGYFSTTSMLPSLPPDLPPELLEEMELQHQQMLAHYQFPYAFDNIFSTTQSIGVFLLVILAASIVGSEYSWGTVRQMLVKRGIRWQYLGAKVITLIIMALIGLVVALVVGTALAAFTTYQIDGGISWEFLSASFFGKLALAFVCTALSLFVFMLLTVFFAVLGHSLLVGIAGGLGFFIIENILVNALTLGGGWLANVPNYMIGRNIQALNNLGSFSANSGFTYFGSPLPSPLHAGVTLTIYCIVFLALSLYIFRIRDITA